MRLPLTFALLALAAPVAARAQDHVVTVAGNDAEMNAAIGHARAELPVFFGHATSPAPGETQFLIKYDLEPEPDKTEFIWAEVISHGAGLTLARLANTPDDPRFHAGQQVTVPDRDIIDWGYRRGTVMQGNYTTQVLLKRLPAADAAAARKALGW
jgi:uncharacterized protein YegJ (DUF2314 family)